MGNPTVKYVDFSGGVVNARENPLAYPANALLAGKNIEISDKSLRTRQGYTQEYNGFTGGTVEALYQARLATTGASYLLAQVRVGGGSPSCKLYASATQLPATPVFYEIYDLGVTAGTCSFTTLNDRVIITEGTSKRPLVFSGCMTTTGADWTYPRHIILTVNGIDFYDETLDLCDTDADTTVDISSWAGHSDHDYIYLCCDQPESEGIYIGVTNTNTTVSNLVMEYWDGANWSGVPGMTDGTASPAGTTLGQSGAISWARSTGAYKLIQGLAGYWLRVGVTVTLDASVSINQIRYKPPCQYLQSIGPSYPDNCMGFVYHDVSLASIKEYTDQVSDASPYTYATLSDGNTTTPTGMEEEDAIYIGYPTPFNTIEFTPENNHNNSLAAVAVTLTVKYWNGSAWAAVADMTDNTAATIGANAITMCEKATVTFTLPTAWRECKPLDTFAMGYWVQLTVSAHCYDYLMISEVGIYPVPEALKKHKFAATLRDRIVLAKRSDAPDQIDISAPLQEYAWTGPDAYALRVGGMDTIAALLSLYNQAWVGKADEWYQLNGYSPTTFASERAETSGMAPVNSQVCVAAPINDQSGVRQGVYFLNHTGAWMFTGVQIIKLSDKVTWFDPSSVNPRIDLDYLHLAHGAFNSEKGWVIWSVPLIVDAGTSQTTCNYLIVYDVGLGVWLTPFDIAVSSMVNLRLYNANAPGYIGRSAFYAGTTAGQILRLFNGTTDNAAEIVSECWTGWSDFGVAEVEKQIRSIWMYGYTSGSQGVTMTVYTDGEQTPDQEASKDFMDLTGLSGQDWTPSQEKEFLAIGHFFKFYLHWHGPSTVYGFQVELPAIRDEELVT